MLERMSVGAAGGERAGGGNGCDAREERGPLLSILGYVARRLGRQRAAHLDDLAQGGLGAITNGLDHLKTEHHRAEQRRRRAVDVVVADAVDDAALAAVVATSALMPAPSVLAALDASLRAASAFFALL